MVRLALALLLLTLGAAPAMGAVTGSIQGTTLTISGDAANDTIAISPSADTTTLGVDTNGDGSADLSFDRSTFDKTIVDAGAGNDVVAVSGDTTTDGISIEGGPGDDFIVDGRGSDLLQGGAGDDTFVWNPGDASDTIDGDEGVDHFVMNGSAVNEHMDVSANGDRVRLTRDVANVTQDLGTVEIVDLRLGAGTDTYTGGAGLAGLVSSVVVNGGPGADTLTGGDADETLIGGPDADVVQGGAGDDTFPVSALDTTESVDGGEGGDTIAVTGTDAGDAFKVDSAGPGQAALTQSFSPTLFASGTGIERVGVDARGGDDSVTVTPAAADELTFDLSGGAGDDTLNGGQGPDTLRGGDGNDTLRAGAGNDQLFGDAGNDTLAGQAGADAFHCGGPTDTLDATAEDTVDPDCVAAPVLLPPVTVPPDLTAPKLTITGLPKSIGRRRLLIRGLVATIKVNEPVALDADLLARTRRAKLSAATPNLTLVHRSLPLSASTRRVRMKPSKRLVGRQRHFTLTVRIVATDASRNRSTYTRTIRVR